MPKIIGKSLHEHRQMTRQKLFTALSTLMAERGFDTITLADIAEAAGVGRTAVYNHFHDKEALLLGFITHETEQYAHTLERALDGIDHPVEQLRTYIRQQAQLTRVFHLAPGPDLRTVLSRATQAACGSMRRSSSRSSAGSSRRGSTPGSSRPRTSSPPCTSSTPASRAG